MEFDNKRIDKLRYRLIECYKFNYKDNKQKLGYLKSEFKSESNPFIQLLSVDLSDRFSTFNNDGSEKKSGFSKYTLKEFFFNKERTRYDTDAIPNLELYCSEIEAEMPSQKGSYFKSISFKTKHRSKIITSCIVIFVLLILIKVLFFLNDLPFKEIEIGNQTWSSEINIPIEGSFCYGDTKENCDSFGRLYFYESAKKIADKFEGWELPLSEDYDDLINYLGDNDKVMSKLMKGGASGFDASFSGYKSIGIDGETKEEYDYIELGKEVAFWTSSIGEVTDSNGKNRPFALRLTKYDLASNVCDCWTTDDALSLRLIKTSRGHIQNYIKDELSDDEKRKITLESDKIQTERIKILNDLYSKISDELKTDFNLDLKRNLSDELIEDIVAISNSFKPYGLFKERDVFYLSPERAQIFASLLRRGIEEESLNKILLNANFKDADFSNIDLSGVNLAKNLYGITGSYKNEVSCLITSTRRIDFSGCNFRDANLDNTILYGNFTNATFSNSTYSNIKFVWSILNSSSFENTQMNNVSFEHSDMQRSFFKSASFFGGDGFSNCDLRGAKFNNSTFVGQDFPFVFKNNFLSTKGTFFEYELFNTSLRGKPFIEESPLIDEDIYFIFKDLNYHNYAPSKITKSNLDSAFVFTGKPSNERIFFSLLHNKDSTSNHLFQYMVRTNDNLNRSSKSLRRLVGFNNTRWEISESKVDTFYRRSSLNKLEIEYRDLTYNYKPKAKYMETASFKNCKFSFTHFIDSSLEYVSFENAKFHSNGLINNMFINAKLFSNDFRIKEGSFLFDENTTYDDLQINSAFPLLNFIKEKKEILLDKSFNEHLVKKNKYKNKGILYVNAYQEENERKLEWVEFMESYCQLDTIQFSGEKNIILRNTYKSPVKIPYLPY